MRNNPVLDALVSEKILGRKPVGAPALPYSGDIAAAWEVVEKVCEQGYRLQLDGSRLWQARFYKSVAHTLETKAQAGTGGSAAEAICAAALALYGVELPKSRY